MIASSSSSSSSSISGLFQYLYFVTVLLNSVYNRQRDKLYSRRIAPSTKDEATEYRALWRCCQPPRLIYPHPPTSQGPASPVIGGHSATGRMMNAEGTLTTPAHCIYDQRP